MLSSVDLLHQRLDLLERTYVGGQVDPKWSGDLLQRIDTLSARYTCLQDETPVFRACYESVMKVKPLILERKASLTVLTQQLEGLLASKETLQARIETVLAVGDLAATLYSDDLKDVDKWSQQLEGLKGSLLLLKGQAKEQTQEVDELLNLFEQAMAVMSDVCSTWERKLKALSPST